MLLRAGIWDLLSVLRPNIQLESYKVFQLGLLRDQVYGVPQALVGHCILSTHLFFAACIDQVCIATRNIDIAAIA